MERSKLYSSRHFKSCKSEILKNQVLSELFSSELCLELLRKHRIEFRSRLFDPLTTIWVFITQVLGGDQSCRSAIAHFLSTLATKSCSLSTGAYCRARERLELGFLSELVQSHAKQNQEKLSCDWRWKGRSIELVDGTTVLLPDTIQNHGDFPSHNPQKRKVSFPSVICRATGTVLDAAMGKYQGKGTGETSLLKQLIAAFDPTDIAVLDRYYSGYWIMSWLVKNQIDVVTRQHQLRFKKGPSTSQE